MEFLIYASLIIITLCCLWAIISIPKQYLFKAILIPTMLVVAVSMWYTYNAIFGYGTEFKPTKTVIYHSHVDAKAQNRIYVLLDQYKISAADTKDILLKIQESFTPKEENDESETDHTESEASEL